MRESIIADRVRELRRRRGQSQEELAEVSGVSYAVIKKIEQGGNVRMETLHKIAKAFGVVTVYLVAPSSPEPTEAAVDDLVLAEMRSAIHPPVSITGHPIFGLTEAGAPDLAGLRRAVNNVATAYHADRYDDLAGAMPALVRSAHHHVEAFDTGDEQNEAVRLRADITGLAGRYLIQIRAHDLALIALQTSLRDAIKIGDTPLAAAAVSSQAWAMLRQGRLGEAEQLCVKTADEIEPKMSTATPDQLSSWGWLLARAAAAASRNNRPREAREYAAVARTAGARLEHEHEDLAGHHNFGPVSAAVMGPEIEILADQPDAALRLANQIPRDAGRANTSTWNRHLLDVANAHVATGNADKATDIMDALRRQHPEWLRYQQYGRDVTRSILSKRPRMPNEAQRQLAEFMNVEG
ncbi:helix-turn-helix transcriptional regulator [Actinoallomurus sp. NPDC052274]|uniref:helix-turn-helix domain-containing protein n=1 Tax=Actinoallomurus sp. NPDC052274 TaxID=3155420 RepID=UPI0034212D01